MTVAFYEVACVAWKSERKRERACARESPSRAPVFSCAHYFQATQAIFMMVSLGSLSIMDGVQNLIICVKMAWGEHLPRSDEYSLNML